VISDGAHAGIQFWIQGLIVLFNKAKNLTNRLGYHLLFVCMNDADLNPAGRRGNHARVRRIVLFFEFDSKES
jgi:hypothetical protein